jgi:cytoskeletal protein CcmA (bactofilin family)
MSWFKTGSSGENMMSNAMFEPRAARPATPDSRAADFDMKPLTRAATPARTETRPTTEPRPAASPETEGSVLGATLRFKGELRADEDFVLQGRVDGSIHHSQNLTIGTDGVVKGDSRAATIVVDGTVEGDLYALESISLRATAKVQGNLLAPRIAIADGASFNGKVDMASATRAVRHIAERHTPALAAETTLPETLLIAAELGKS